MGFLKWLAVAVAGLTLSAGLVVPQPAVATATTSTDPATRTGLSPDTAAASCWEAKQVRPTATSGTYWLLTPRMSGPEQFWCDMTTGGGGWVRIASGREQWTTAYDGKGRAAHLRVAQPVLTTTTQLPSTTVDALLNGTRVDQLSDQVRVRRAVDATGSTFQEVRFQFARRDRWVWTMGAEHAVARYRFGTVTGTGGQTSSFGTNEAWNRVYTAKQAAQQYKWGWAYGAAVTGTNSSTTYLWASTDGQGNAMPYSEVYLRPRLLSSDLTFPLVPDTGTKPLRTPRVPNSAALVNPWGVAGTAGSTATEGNVEVQALEQIGNVMYVGGNFRHVQRDAAGTGRVAQPFLAAFNATTGEHLPRFAPSLNEQVRALKALPNGHLAVGGDFTRVNGRAVRALVAVSPTTGATLSTWGTRVESTSASGVTRIRSMDVSGKQLYLGGTFTHLSRSDGSGRVAARNAGRVSRATGNPSSWSPDFNGTVLDVDVSADGTRAYFSGHFSTYRGAPALRAAAILTAAAAPLDSTVWKPAWSTTNKTYQRSILQAGDRVWVGGSEHSLFSFSTSTYKRLGGSIMKRGGDVQVIEAKGRRLFAGCHCNDWAYQDAYTWPTIGTGWTQADTIGWFGQWHTGTGRYVPHFTPEFSSRRGSGIWAIKVATDGTVWAGGDVTTGRTTSGSRWLGGFGRWAPRDSTAPGAPSALRVVSQGSETVALAWDASTGAPARYQVLRDDRVVAMTTGTQLSLTVPNGGRNRFFVRAVDAAGNVSASTPVLVSSPAG